MQFQNEREGTCSSLAWSEIIVLRHVLYTVNLARVIYHTQAGLQSRSPIHQERIMGAGSIWISKCCKGLWRFDCRDLEKARVPSPGHCFREKSTGVESLGRGLEVFASVGLWDIVLTNQFGWVYQCVSIEEESYGFFRGCSLCVCACAPACRHALYTCPCVHIYAFEIIWDSK